MANQAHLALDLRSGVGVAFDAGRMCLFGFQSELVTGIADVFDVAEVFAQTILDCGSVTVSAINLNGFIGDEQAFDFPGVRRVFELRVFRRRSRAALLSRGVRQQIGPTPEGANDNEGENDNKFFDHCCGGAIGAVLLWNIRVPREFDVRQSHAAHKELISANGFGRFKTDAARSRDDVVLINAIAADADGADQRAIFVKRHAARENLSAVGQARNRCATRHWLASQNLNQRPSDQRGLQAGVEGTPDIDRF